METKEQEFTEQLNHNHLIKAYLRLAAESKKIAESPGVVAIRGEPPKQKKPKKTKEQPPEQLQLF